MSSVDLGAVPGNLLCHAILAIAHLISILVGQGYWEPETAHTSCWDVCTGTVSTCCDGCVDLRSRMVKNVGAQPT